MSDEVKKAAERLERMLDYQWGLDADGKDKAAIATVLKHLATVAADEQRIKELLSEVQDIADRIGVARQPLEIRDELYSLFLRYKRTLTPIGQEAGK